jgi:hypothetical protein
LGGFEEGFMLIQEDVSHLRGMENNYSLDAEK